LFKRIKTPDITDALLEVIPMARGRPDEAFYDFNAQIGKMYSWMNVTVRTERVYDSIADTPIRSSLDRMKRFSIK
jgi:hypothetical protein